MILAGVEVDDDFPTTLGKDTMSCFRARERDPAVAANLDGPAGALGAQI